MLVASIGDHIVAQPLNLVSWLSTTVCAGSPGNLPAAMLSISFENLKDTHIMVSRGSKTK